MANNKKKKKKKNGNNEKRRFYDSLTYYDLPWLSGSQTIQIVKILFLSRTLRGVAVLQLLSFLKESKISSLSPSHLASGRRRRRRPPLLLLLLHHLVLVLTGVPSLNSPSTSSIVIVATFYSSSMHLVDHNTGSILLLPSSPLTPLRYGMPERQSRVRRLGVSVPIGMPGPPRSKFPSRILVAAAAAFFGSSRFARRIRDSLAHLVDAHAVALRTALFWRVVVVHVVSRCFPTGRLQQPPSRWWLLAPLPRFSYPDGMRPRASAQKARPRNGPCVRGLDALLVSSADTLCKSPLRKMRRSW